LDILYYQNDKYGSVVRLKNHNIEIYRANDKRWEILPPDNSYMREIFLGQGNNCLTQITKEQAMEITGDNSL